MDNIGSTTFVFDSVALDAPKNDIETLTFSKMQKKQEKKYAPCRAWTRVLSDKSQVLYQLSYGLIIFSLEKLNDYVKAVFDIHFK